MKTSCAIVSILVVFLALPAVAKSKNKGTPTPDPRPPELRVVEVNAVSITVTVGKSGDEHFTYKITDDTKVTLNGAPVFARDLRAGMLARIEISPDHTTALSITARDAPAYSSHGHVG